MTFPASEAQGPGQTPATYPGVFTPNTTTPTALTEHFTEGLDIGYRWYQATGQRPLFPFCFGLSYTRFAYGWPRLSEHRGGASTITVSITNTGRVAGAEVPQLYLHYPAAAGEPVWSLKGFDKVDLQPGQRATVSFALGRRLLRTFNDATGRWGVTPGRYTVAVGSSSADLRTETSFVVGRGRWHR